MNNTRTTKEIVTPSGKKVVINEYITGGESRKIQALYMEGLTAIEFKAGDTNSLMSKIPITTVFKAQEMALGFLIVSVDGETENAYSKAMELKEDDLEFIMKEVDEITTGILKKNLESAPSTSEDKS